MGKIIKDTIHANGIDIGIYTQDFENEFISLTDIARYKSDDPTAVMQNRMRNGDVIEFQLYIMKDYRRLKTDENSRLSLNWNLNREISKLNYRIHTDAIKDNLIPPELTPAQVTYAYANEADMLNVVLFGKTAKQWKDENPTVKGNMRDAATLNQLLALADLESYNAVLINQGKNQKERMERSVLFVERY